MNNNAGWSVEVPARAALAGNPSDGHGGAVLALPVPALSATVSIGSGPRPTDDANRLIEAARSVFASVGTPRSDARWGVDTSIPREVGLSGSSAIVIGALEVMAAQAGVDLGPVVVAAMAQAAEAEVLGWPAGLQDRVVQAHRQPMLMEFDEPSMSVVDGWRSGHYQPVEVPSLRLFIAWDPACAEASGAAHRRSPRAAPDAVRSAMRRSAQYARDAAAALHRGGGPDVDALADAMSSTLAARRDVFDVRSDHLALADAYEAVPSVAVNFAGSGGAIVGLSTAGGRPVEAARRLAAGSSHGFIEL